VAAKFEIRPAKDGFRFVLKAANGEVVATSESYPENVKLIWPHRATLIWPHPSGFLVSPETAGI
jgi:hypothetical protein